VAQLTFQTFRIENLSNGVLSLQSNFNLRTTMKTKSLQNIPALLISALIALPALGLMGMSAFQKPKIEAVLEADHRSDEERARDKFRHPAATLDFFGLEPDMTVAEIWPGGSAWYLKVIAPMIKEGGGTYVAVTPMDPASDNERVVKSIKAFKANFVDKPEIYGNVTMALMRGPKNDIATPGSLDMVLTFRNVHNWMTGDPETDYADEYMAAYFKALKPGGILGVVEHRANADAEPDPAARNGYVQEAQVLALAEAAGFEFIAKSDINANPADTKDHPFGVWTLPPTKQSAGRGQESSPDFDGAKYDSIGESDRMTMKFRKPE
jgi:predicted methyltransferase